MRYKLMRELKVIGESDALTDLVDSHWLTIKENWGDGFVIEDTKAGVKFSVFSICWRNEYNGFEISSITQ
jgi:hypothetical protein